MLCLMIIVDDKDQWPIQNIFLLRSPLYSMSKYPVNTVENARQKYSGYATDRNKEEEKILIVSFLTELQLKI